MDNFWVLTVVGELGRSIYRYFDEKSEAVNWSKRVSEGALKYDLLCSFCEQKEIGKPKFIIITGFVSTLASVELEVEVIRGEQDA